MVEIAHPDHREALAKAAHERFGSLQPLRPPRA
jgi:acyl-CoA hydrolase